jgi:hypothetical protein
VLSERTRLGFTVLGGAFALGIAADALLRVGPWGINLSLFVFAMVAVLIVSARRHDVSLGAAAWIAIPAALFGAAYGWHDSPVLRNLNLTAAIVALALLAVYAGRTPILASLAEIAARLAVHLFDFAVGSFPAMLGVQWKEIQGLRLGAAWSTARAIAIAVPVVLLFGKLLSAADAVFDALALEVFRIDLADLAIQLVVVVWVAYFAAAWLSRALGQQRLNPSVPGGKLGLLGRVELTVVLGSLNLLFAAFVVIQGALLLRRRGSCGDHAELDLRGVRAPRLL